MYTVSKFLQALGLVLVPLGLYYGMTHDEEGAIARELMIMAAGAVLFALGRLLERRFGS